MEMVQAVVAAAKLQNLTMEYKTIKTSLQNNKISLFFQSFPAMMIERSI